MTSNPEYMRHCWYAPTGKPFDPDTQEPTVTFYTEKRKNGIVRLYLWNPGNGKETKPYLSQLGHDLACEHRARVKMQEMAGLFLDIYGTYTEAFVESLPIQP